MRVRVGFGCEKPVSCLCRAGQLAVLGVVLCGVVVVPGSGFGVCPVQKEQCVLQVCSFYRWVVAGGGFWAAEVAAFGFCEGE